MNRPTRRLIVAVSWLLLSAIPIALADQPSPLPNTFVHDFAGVISDEWKAEIQSKSQRLKDEYKTEIAIVTIDSLEGEDVFDYSVKMARDWGIGSKDNDIRGLLILVAINERKTAFRTSRHVEGEIPDSITFDISNGMNDFFKKGDFGGGLSAGMDKILERMQVVYESPNNSSTGLGWLWALIIGLPVALLVGFVALWDRRSRKRHERRMAEEAATRKRSEYFSSTARASSKTRSKKRKGKTAQTGKRKSGVRDSKPSPGYKPSYGSSSSSYSSDSSSNSSSSSYDSGSSSSSDSGSSYSGGSDFGGGGSDSSW